MKKLVQLSVAVFIAVVVSSCSGGDKQKDCPEVCPNAQDFRKECPEGKRPCERGERGPRSHHNPMDRPDLTPEQKEKFAKWMHFDSLSVEEQKALLLERKAEIDERDSIHKARQAEFEEKWKNFESLSVEEQKALLDMKGHGPFLKPRGKKVQKPGHCGVMKRDNYLSDPCE